MRNIPLFALFVAAAAAASLSSPAEGAEQQSYSGIPMAQYCNVVPDLSIDQTNSVDNWTRICSVWLAATGGRAGPAKPFGRWSQGSEGLGVDRRGSGPVVKPHRKRPSSRK